MSARQNAHVLYNSYTMYTTCALHNIIVAQHWHMRQHMRLVQHVSSTTLKNWGWFTWLLESFQAVTICNLKQCQIVCTFIWHSIRWLSIVAFVPRYLEIFGIWKHESGWACLVNSCFPSKRFSAGMEQTQNLIVVIELNVNVETIRQSQCCMLHVATSWYSFATTGKVNSHSFLGWC